MKSYAILLFACLIISCKGDDKSDAYGNFEATTITVSAKGNGELMRFDLQEGQVLKEDVLIGLIDTTNLHLEKLKLQAQIDALDLKLQEAAPEISVLLKDRINLIRERNPTRNLGTHKTSILPIGRFLPSVNPWRHKSPYWTSKFRIRSFGIQSRVRY